MLKPALLLRIFSELVLVLLGLLLVQVAVTGRLLWNRRSPAWIAVGFLLIYWGVRAWMRRRGTGPLWTERMRAGSLVLVGVVMLAIARVPFDYVAPLLAAAGGVLILRGAVSAALVARSA
jgi:hypothetical protein